MTSSILLLICGIIQLSRAQYYYNQLENDFGVISDSQRGEGYYNSIPQNPLKLPTRSNAYTKSQNQLQIVEKDYIPPRALPTTVAPISRAYVYPTPSIPTTIPLKQPIPQRINIGYQYPKPQIPFELPKPTSKNNFIVADHKTRFQYSKPQKSLLITTPEPKEVIVYHPKIQNGYQYPKPQIPFELPIKIVPKKEINVGYHYPKPQNTLPLPTTTLPLQKPKENVIINRPQNSIGYQYPKPINPLTLPPAKPSLIPTRPLIISSTPSVPKATQRGYSYPIPSNPIILPPRQPSTFRGYDYPKPTIPFNIPSRPATISPFKETTFSGYQYPKPIIPFEPVPVNDISEGYSYPRPSIPFFS